MAVATPPRPVGAPASLSSENPPDREAPADPAAALVAKLASSFSQTLAGRFPFVRSDLARGAPDADPDDVQTFYRLMDETKVKLGRDVKPELKAFFDQMETARPLLDAVARSSGLTVDLAYGVNRAAEVGGEHIIDWSVRSGATAVGAGAAGTQLVWKAGQPVLMSFRWAAGSPFRPKSAAASETAAVAGDTLTVAERGPWALLRLMKTRAVPGGGEGTLVRMVLPTQTIAGVPARDTVVFMTASLKGGSRNSAPLRLYDLPLRFP